MHDVDDAEGAAAERAEEGQAGDAPEQELEVEVAGDGRAVVGLANGHGEHGVGDHPGDDHVSAHGAVVVLLLLGLADAGGGDLEPVAEVAQGLVVAGVDVELLGGHLERDSVAGLADRGAEVGVDDVVALGAPGDVVGVAEGVHLQGADVGGQQGEVLRRGGEHVPGVEVQEGHEEVEADGGGGTDDQVCEDVVAEHEGREGVFELRDDDIERAEEGVRHDDGVDDHAGHEHPFRAVDRRFDGQQESRLMGQDKTYPWGRLPMERMNWVHIRRIQAKRRSTNMYSPRLWPKGSSLGSDKDPAIK